VTDCTPHYIPATADDLLHGALAELRDAIAKLRPLVAKACAMAWAAAERQQKIAEDV
jgi:hypothetical protein